MKDVRRAPGYKLFVWAMILFPVGFVLSSDHDYLSRGVSFAVRMVGTACFCAAFLMILGAYTKAVQAIPGTPEEGIKS